ncbi:MAG: dephospho-CoA kinase [Prochloraceae cyanobacterium]
MPNHPQRAIGLTGGIGTGKTTVSKYLAEKYHLPVLDADIYAREAVQPGSPILQEIVNRYGNKIQLPDGILDRQLLGKIIFNNLEERGWLEKKIHPYVRSKLESELKQIKADLVVLVVPLLFEANMTDLVTEIWLVYCPYEQQIRRIIERDSLNEKQANARINSQLALEKKVALADVVLDNSSTLDYLLRQVDTVLNESIRQRAEGKGRKQESVKK